MRTSIASLCPRAPRTAEAAVAGLLAVATGCPMDVGLDDTSTAAETAETAGSGDATSTSTTTGGAPTTTAPATTSGEPGTTAALSDPTSNSESSTGPGDPGSTSSTSGEPGETSATSDSGGSSTSGGEASGSSSGSSGEASGSSSGDASSSSGDDTTTTGSSSDSGDDTTTGGEELVVLPLCCEPGCSTTLLQSASTGVKVLRDGARFTTHDATKGLVLWDATTLQPLLRADAVDGAALVGGTLAYRRAGVLHVVDAVDVVELGACPAGAAHGVALDGGYVWTAGPAGLEVLDLDCGLRWAVAGDLGGAKALAMPDALHVYEPDLGPQQVSHFDAVDGASTTAPFLGGFGGWFADAPRFWTTQGDAYRVYDLDDAQIGGLEQGKPTYGWGTRLVGFNSAWDIFGGGAVSVTQTHKESGPAVLGFQDGGWRIVRLDAEPMTSTPLALPGELQGASSFAFADEAWVIGDLQGSVFDQDLRRATIGALRRLYGSIAGRVLVETVDQGLLHYVLDDEACTTTVHPSLPLFSGLLRMSGDGALLLSAELWKDPNAPWYVTTPYPGTRFYALPGGEKLAESHMVGMKAAGILGYDVSDAGDAWALAWDYVGEQHAAGSFPLGDGYASGAGSEVPKLSPSGAHVVRSDAEELGQFKVWAGKFGYVHDHDDLVGAFEGIPHGFIDDEHILVGRYVGQDTFVATQIVDLDGTVVQTTDLPNIRALMRTGGGEILGHVHPSNDAAIYDPWTGVALWTAPPGARVVVAGPDIVVFTDGARLVATRWH